MATKIEDIYSSLNTLIAAALPDYRQFPNPYVVDVNTFLHMRAGYGIAIGPGVNTERFTSCIITWQRSFTIVLVRQIMTTQNNIAERQLLESEILADHDALLKLFEGNSTLDGQAIKSIISDDGGINFIDGDTLKFLSLEMNLVVEYREPV